MKLMIYLASHDPEAQENFRRLYYQRTGNIRDTTYCYIHAIGENLAPTHLNRNLFDNILLSARNNVSIEFIAHGSPNINNELLSIPKGSYKERESNTFTVIKPETIERFFKDYAYDIDSKQYKFASLTLFCCNSVEFGKNLSRLMPEVNVTCFAEAIQIHNNGIAYPYTAEKIPKPLDANGNVITFDMNNNPSAPHLPARERIFSAGIELIKNNENKFDANEVSQSTDAKAETLSVETSSSIRRNPFQNLQNQSSSNDRKDELNETLKSLENLTTLSNTLSASNNTSKETENNKTMKIALLINDPNKYM